MRELCKGVYKACVNRASVGLAMAERIEGRSVTNPLFFEDHDPIPDTAVHASYNLNPLRNVNAQHGILPTWQKITPAPPTVSAPVDAVIIHVVQKQVQQEVVVQSGGIQDPTPVAQSLETPSNEEDIRLEDITDEEKQEIREIGEQLLSMPVDERRSKFSSDRCLTSLQCNFKKIKSLYQFRRRRIPPPTRSPPTTPPAQMTGVLISGSLTPCVGTGVPDLSTTAAFTQDENAKPVEAEDLLTEDLKQGRKSGWRIYTKYAFPMVNDIVRDIWVCAELFTVLFSIIFSAVTFGLGSNAAFNVIHLVLSIIATLLALVDSFLQLKDFKSCRACKRYHRNVRKAKQETEEGAEPTGFICCSCLKDEEDRNQSNSDTESGKKRCSAGWWKDVADVLRTFISEAIFYPLLICDIFEFITARGWRLETQEERVSFALFVISVFAIILYAYVARIALLCITIYNVQKRRWASENVRTGLVLQIYFAVHVFLQMLAQIFMLIAIGAKIHYENRNYDPNDPNSQINASSYLWYMIIAGYVMPFCGILTFYIVAYYWVQQFPIGLCVDFLKILATPSANQIFHPQQSAKEHMKVNEDILDSLDEPDYSIRDTLLQRLRFPQMSENFRKLRNKGFSDKFAYPFKSPFIVILCIVYAAFQLAFIICAVRADDSVNPVVLTEGSGWSIFYAIGVIIGIIANLYVFSIASLWVTIVLLVIAAIIAAISLWMFLNCLAASADRR